MPARRRRHRHRVAGGPPRVLEPNIKRGAMEAVIGVLILVILILAVTTLVRSVRVVPQQRMDVVERLGKYKRTLSPGLNLLIPNVDSVRNKLDMREAVVSFPPPPVITSDN